MGRERTRIEPMDEETRVNLKREFKLLNFKPIDYYEELDLRLPLDRFYAALRGEDLSEDEVREMNQSYIAWLDYKAKKWGRDGLSVVERFGILGRRYEDAMKELREIGKEMMRLTEEMSEAAPKARGRK